MQKAGESLIFNWFGVGQLLENLERPHSSKASTMVTLWWCHTGTRSLHML